MARRNSGKGAVRRHRDGRYYVDFGPKHRIWSVPVGDQRMPMTAEMAEFVLTLVRSALGQGKDLPSVIAEYEPRHAHANLVTTRLERWLDVKRREAAARDRSSTYVAELERWARPGGLFGWWAGKSIRDVSEAALEDWALWLADQPSRARWVREGARLAPATRARVLAGFRSFLGWLYHRHEIAELPRRFPWPRVPERERRVLTIADQEAILAAIPAPDRGIFLALARLGIRPNEARALEVADYRDGQIAIDKKCVGQRVDAPVVRGTKNRYARTLPVDEELADWIAEHVPAQARLARRRLFVLSSTGGPWSHASLVDRWQAACQAVGVTGVSLYPGTKHTMATDAVRRGVPERALQAFLGHRDVRSTRTYARLGDQALVSVLRPKRGEG